VRSPYFDALGFKTTRTAYCIIPRAEQRQDEGQDYGNGPVSNGPRTGRDPNPANPGREQLSPDFVSIVELGENSV
jgi:hypothetical protein